MGTHAWAQARLGGAWDDLAELLEDLAPDVDQLAALLDDLPETAAGA